MPKQYMAIRDKFVREGMALKSAKTHAAKIYNSGHPDAPVGRYDSESGGKRDNRENRSSMSLSTSLKPPGPKLPSLGIGSKKLRLPSLGGGKLFRKGTSF